ncbi:DNA-processing protein DprA [Agriterribacter sp.]|uniref:DNA-processing protein DprA n=1 Tax=Agriterribacter sp. TaxID=2821509 RepID=UPI002BC5431F|nr:DNA-processing protein DprA [Agriterribacter sp.]HRO46041.1 DNA-processing protein DprA [Agriterribacter sp.]HRQ17077.1 DNA-processing protein DprA [Agriterribacter sp.]
MHSDLLYHIALTMVPQIGDVHAKELLQHFGDAEKIFAARKSSLDKFPGIGTIRSESIKTFSNFQRAEEELRFIERYNITVLRQTDAGYPKRLLHCYDAPSLLYYKGNADLNHHKIMAVIGTRSHTDYGKEMTGKIIEDMASHHVLVVSGLAYGIDALAHKAALKNKLLTIGVLAHGLDRIYPSANKTLAKEMTTHGGLLTDFMSGAKPDKQNFPKRNRIVAGMADATLVIETQVNGGSMITAELANNYNKDVFALPGKTTDVKSAGCNYLIRSNKAALITSGKELLDFMNWSEAPVKKKAIQKELFLELTAEEKMIMKIIGEKETASIDEITPRCNFSSSTIAAAMLNLELQGIITCLPGKIYKLL